MKNAFLRYSSTCASLLIAGAFIVTAASAAVRNLAAVTFAEPVTVGSATLPAGQYTIADQGDDAFLVQSENGDHSVIVFGRRVNTDGEAAQTKVILTPNAEGMQLDKLVIAGESTAYDFAH